MRSGARSPENLRDPRFVSGSAAALACRDEVGSAGPLKRVIQKRLVDRLALAILEGEFQPGDTVRVEAADGDLVFTKAPVAVPEAEAAAA